MNTKFLVILMLLFSMTSWAQNSTPPYYQADLQKMTKRFSRCRSVKRALRDKDRVYAFMLLDPKLKALPEDFANLNNLQYFEFRNYKRLNLAQAFDILSKLPKLYYVCIQYPGNNHTTGLPHTLGQLNKLVSLDIHNWHDLHYFPTSMSNLDSLSDLRIRYCDSVDLDNLASAIQTIRKLSMLDIDKSSHLKISEGCFKILGQLKSLRWLSLSQSDIKTIYSDLGELKHLTYLTLSGNQIRQLPNTIGKLEQLRDLHLNSNHLSVLPKEIGQLVKLKILDLSENKLRTLPQEMANLTHLKELYLHDNLFSEAEKIKVKKMLPNTKVYF